MRGREDCILELSLVSGNMRAFSKYFFQETYSVVKTEKMFESEFLLISVMRCFNF